MMKKIKKIKIKINGKIILVNDNSNLQELVNKLKIPVKKVAIEDKSKLKKYILKKKDKIEIVHFIGGG